MEDMTTRLLSLPPSIFNNETCGYYAYSGSDLNCTNRQVLFFVFRHSSSHQGDRHRSSFYGRWRKVEKYVSAREVDVEQRVPRRVEENPVAGRTAGWQVLHKHLM
jgi:hypothetical protein